MISAVSIAAAFMASRLAMPKQISIRRPGFTCTLCGDCLAGCKDNQIHYRFPGLGPLSARAVFTVIIVALHASFLGVARL